MRNAHDGDGRSSGPAPRQCHIASIRFNTLPSRSIGHIFHSRSATRPRATTPYSCPRARHGIEQFKGQCYRSLSLSALAELIAAEVVRCSPLIGPLTRDPTQRRQYVKIVAQSMRLHRAITIFQMHRCRSPAVSYINQLSGIGAPPQSAWTSLCMARYAVRSVHVRTTWKVGATYLR